VGGSGHDIVVRAPSHLGDGVMAEPAIRALATVGGRLRVQAPPWGAAIYRGLEVSAPLQVQAEVAVLLAPSLRAAWQLRRARRRVGLATDFRGALLTDVVIPARHRAETYARIVAVLGARVARAPRVSSAEACPEGLPAGHIGLAPISRSGPVVQWAGFAELARRLDGPVIAYGALDEREAIRAAAPTADARFVGLAIDAQIAAFTRCAVLVSNDSGLAHLARAAGVPTVVVHGSTHPENTGAHGAMTVQGPDPGCRPCYRKRCARGDLACLDVPVEPVLRAVRRALAARSPGE